MEKKTDWRKNRKSTHLSSADMDILETEGKPLIFTIKEVKYETNVDVSGKKMDGNFCYFHEKIKPLKLNSTNSFILAGFAKQDGFVGKDCHIIENWVNMRIEFYVDRNVKLKGEIVDGLRIRPIRPELKKIKPDFLEANFEKAKIAGATIEMIEKSYSISEENKIKYGNYGK